MGERREMSDVELSTNTTLARATLAGGRKR